MGEEAAEACGDLGRIWSLLEGPWGSTPSAASQLSSLFLLAPLEPCGLLKAFLRQASRCCPPSPLPDSPCHLPVFP